MKLGSTQFESGHVKGVLVVCRGSLSDELAREPITFCQHEERQCSVTTDYADLKVGSGDVYSS